MKFIAVRGYKSGLQFFQDNLDGKIIRLYIQNDPPNDNFSTIIDLSDKNAINIISVLAKVID